MYYPGSKTSQKEPITAALLGLAGHSGFTFCEPMAGSGAVSLHLMKHGLISNLWLNDADPGIAALWYTIQHYPNILACRIQRLDRDTAVEHFQIAQDRLRAYSGGDILTQPAQDIIDHGFEKLIAHKLSHGGLGMKSICRGGCNQNARPYYDNGRWRINRVDSRWTPEHTIRRIQQTHVWLNRHRARITNFDFEGVIDNQPPSTILYLDPTYFSEGEEMYYYTFSFDDHVRLMRAVFRIPNKWVMSYGDCPVARLLYEGWCNIQELPVQSQHTHKQRMDLVITRK
jgi:DNA adenine methylase